MRRWSFGMLLALLVLALCDLVGTTKALLIQHTSRRRISTGSIRTSFPSFRRPSSRVSSSVVVLFSEESPERDEVETDDGEETAYGNRSLAWTRRYRRLLPYESARQRAMALGLRSKEEWDEYIEDGNAVNGAYLPNRPEEMYPEDFISWEEFLGLMRPYHETKEIVRNVLRLKSMDEYRRFVKADTKRAEGLRIPAQPEIVYEDKGWVSEADFFGSEAL